MIDSLNKFSGEDPRFELTRIRENLSSSFSDSERNAIKKDLRPPGPANLKVLGMSVTNEQTISNADDEFILTEPCSTQFDYHAIIVTNLAELAKEAYGYWDKIVEAVN